MFFDEKTCVGAYNIENSLEHDCELLCTRLLPSVIGGLVSNQFLILVHSMSGGWVVDGVAHEFGGHV